MTNPIKLFGGHFKLSGIKYSSTYCSSYCWTVYISQKLLDGLPSNHLIADQTPKTLWSALRNLVNVTFEYKLHIEIYNKY
jgi:hypothetical protein